MSLRRALRASVTRRQIEYCTVVRACKPVIQPLQESALIVERRHTTVIDGGEHCRTDQNLAARVTLSFELTDACGETDTFGPQTRQAFIECLNSCVALRCLRHGPPRMRGRGICPLLAVGVSGSQRSLHCIRTAGRVCTRPGQRRLVRCERRPRDVSGTRAGRDHLFESGPEVRISNELRAGVRSSVQHSSNCPRENVTESRIGALHLTRRLTDYGAGTNLMAGGSV